MERSPDGDINPIQGVPVLIHRESDRHIESSISAYINAERRGKTIGEKGRLLFYRRVVPGPSCFSKDSDQSPDATDDDAAQQQDVWWRKRTITPDKGVPLHIPAQRKIADDCSKQRDQSTTQS